MPVVEKDAANAKRIALGMGIPEENIKMFTRMTSKAIQKVFREGMKAFITKNLDDKRSFLLVYAAGHGVCDQ